uniref:DUF6534 domain-containing protein n=1 Tax=Mycena chlorophos TaxID=658473 RepID=A0ABQ0LG67_MYCCL|nr:predicted protein [Mycena chlorophos]
MFMYYQTYKKDTVWIRYFVLYLFIAESINLLLEFGIVYQPLIVHYGDPQALIVSPLHAASIVMVSTPIQIFTAWRINVITGKKLFSALIILLALLSFGGGVGVGVFSGVRNEFAEFQSFRGVVSLWLISSAMCDVLIALILTFSLRSRKTGFTAVDGQINRIIRLTVQTGAITAIAALADLILFLAFPTITKVLVTLLDLPHQHVKRALPQEGRRRTTTRSEPAVQRLRKDSAAAAALLQLQLGQNPANGPAAPAPMMLPEPGPRRPMPSGPRTRT